MKLFFEAIMKFMSGLVLFGLLIFLPAGTFNFFSGWLLMTILFVPMFVAGIVMMIKCPELLKRRLDMKEKQKEQSFVIAVCGIMFVAGFVVAGLNFRFDWYVLPCWVQIVSTIFFVTGYVMYAEVIRENKYLSRTITVQENQTVIDTGMYGIVRHPMYFASVILFLAMPLILGSLYSFFIFLIYPFAIVKRIKYEEEFLEKELDGYSEYKKKVKYRLIPYVW